MSCLLFLGLVWSSQAVSQSELAFRNVRPTMGLLGPERRERDTFLPGDLIFYAFDLGNLTPTKDGASEGLYRYAMTVEVLDAKNQVIFPKEPGKPRESQAFCPLGGDVLPTFAYTETDQDIQPGRYVMRLTCVDRVSGRRGTLEKAFQVENKRFGILRPAMLYATSGEPAPGIGVPGQSFMLNFVVANFTVDPKTDNCDVDLTIQILDQGGRPVSPKPFRGQITTPEDPARRLHSIRFPYQPNRAGQFTLEVTALDKKAEGKPVAKFTYPFTVAGAR
ncbi:MAG: hypothetical protein LW700_04690 [Gemmataceae bacterium]|jgi:hypothetical protein|nr:hypothetical protein [Gemmataceae bacterium]